MPQPQVLTSKHVLMGGICTNDAILQIYYELPLLSPLIRCGAWQQVYKGIGVSLRA